MRHSTFALLSLAASASANTTLTSGGCADPSGLDSCLAKSNDQASSCLNQARKDNSQVEVLACGCQNYVNNFNCYAANCWNKVWGCEYQQYMVEYFVNCATAKLDVPYFPAPGNVEAACSCNLGKVFMGVQSAIQESGTCSNNAQGSDPGSNLQRMQGCNCCQVSGALSSIVEICPATDPKLIGSSNIQQIETTINTDFKSCGSYLDTYDCKNDLGFNIDGVKSFLKPNDPLTTGTATLSDMPGTITAPASGKVFSYTNGGDGTVYTITAAGKIKGGKSGGSGSKGNSKSAGNVSSVGFSVWSVLAFVLAAACL